jgi:AraC-like DNA-binding protein
MTRRDCLESRPIRLSKSVFKTYQYKVINLHQTPGALADDGCQEFLFVKQDNVWLKYHGRAPVRVPPAFTLGKSRRPSRFQCSETFDFFSVKLQPWVNRYFFPEDVVDNVIDLQSNYGPGIESLSSEIFTADSFEAMVERTEDFLSTLEMPQPDSYATAMKICQRIYRSKATVPVMELVKEFSQSRQKINREFLQHTKYSIKEFAVAVKVSEAIKFKMRNPAVSFTGLAHSFGYFDQSHFNRDIKRFTNMSPKLLFPERMFWTETEENPA